MLRELLDHRFTKAHASDYLDDHLSASERGRVERHASVCPRCRELLASLRVMVGELSALRTAPPATVADGVIERLRRDP